MAKKRKKIKKKKKPLNLNIGMLIFGAIFIYVIICIIMYFQTSHIVRYEVKEGSLATENIFRGIIIRDETVVNADVAGYVNYYACEGERVAKNDLVYVIDETGRLNEYLQDVNLGENSLSDKELAEFRSELANFKHGFDEKNFDGVYEFKNLLDNTVMKLSNANMLKNIEEMSGGSGAANVVNYCNAPETGIVAYWVDGYESITPDMVTETVLDEQNYEKTLMQSNTLVASGDAVYKLSTDENWSIVVPIDEEWGTEMEEEGYVKVRFLKNQYESWGAATLLHNSDGKTYFNPNRNLTRQEFAVTLARLLGLDTSYTGEMDFADDSSIASWARGAVYAVSKADIMQGSASNGGLYFSPSAQMTRAEVMTVIGRCLTRGYEAASLGYRDASSIPSWAREQVQICVSAGIISGYEDNTLRPLGNITRGEIAKILALF